MSKKVYVVTTGLYSDIDIFGVYSSRSIAKRIANNIDDGDFQKFVLDEKNFIVDDKLPYRVFIWKDKEKKPQAFFTYLLNLSKNSAMSENKDGFSIYLYAKNKREAINIACERHEYFLTDNLYKGLSNIGYYTHEDINGLYKEGV